MQATKTAASGGKDPKAAKKVVDIDGVPDAVWLYVLLRPISFQLFLHLKITSSDASLTVFNLQTKAHIYRSVSWRLV